jgi:hypothetical protein
MGAYPDPCRIRKIPPVAMPQSPASSRIVDQTGLKGAMMIRNFETFVVVSRGQTRSNICTGSFLTSQLLALILLSALSFAQRLHNSTGVGVKQTKNSWRRMEGASKARPVTAILDRNFPWRILFLEYAQ